MKHSPHIRLKPDEITRLLEGQPIEAEFRGPKCPTRGESYPVMMQEAAKVRAVIAGAKLRPGCLRIWTLSVVLDRAEAPMLLNAESAGGVIVPLGEERSESEAAAHGYLDTPSAAVLDAGDAVPHEDVETYAESQAAAQRFAASKVDKFTKRRSRSLVNRVENVLLQAQAHGVDSDTEALEAWIEAHEAALKEAA